MGSSRRAEAPGASYAEDDDQPQLWLSGAKASRRGWVRVSDATEKVFYHSIASGKITLERPVDFGDDNPTWADGVIQARI